MVSAKPGQVWMRKKNYSKIPCIFDLHCTDVRIRCLIYFAFLPLGALIELATWVFDVYISTRQTRQQNRKMQTLYRRDGLWDHYSQILHRINSNWITQSSWLTGSNQLTRRMPQWSDWQIENIDWWFPSRLGMQMTPVKAEGKWETSPCIISLSILESRLV
jgi:hypothetical protein